MKKLTDLQENKTQLTLRYNEIVSNDELTDELRTEAEGISTKITNLDKDIKIAQRAEALAQKDVDVEERDDTEDKNIQERYVEALVNFFKDGKASDEFRGYKGGLQLRDDLLTSTDAGLIIKDVEKSLNIAKTPVLTDKLGTKKMVGMKGQFDLTAMAQVTAGFVGETVAVPDASAYPQTPVTLAPRRLGAYNFVSAEALDSFNPNVWADIVQDINDAWDRKVSSDAIAQLLTDAVDASTTIAGSDFAIADALTLQANIPYDMASPVYLTTPANAAKLAATVSLTAVEGPVWKGNIFEGTVAGIPAYSNSAVPANHFIFVDAAKITTAYFGPKTILYNPYEKDVEGELKVTVSGQVDSGFGNYRFASWFADASIA